ncbi:hypothetical protein [Pseudomonas syringae]|uniref:hypothetical protein n=1 Tax=Pseudomonas syringae TaxID=317 RepID=UPI003F85C945
MQLHLASLAAGMTRLVTPEGQVLIMGDTPEEQRMLTDAQRYDRELSGYMKVHSTRPHSVGYFLSDSPVGLATWLYALFQDAADSGGEPKRVIQLDALIDDHHGVLAARCRHRLIHFYWERMREMQ